MTTPMRILSRASTVLVGAFIALVLAVPTIASAHSLDSTTLSVRVTEEGVDATISLAADSLDGALGADHTAVDTDTYGDLAVAYLAEHLTVTGADGAVWAESFGEPVLEPIEGIDSLVVDVDLDTGGAATSSFTIAYDGIVEVDAGHEAVVVLTDVDGSISTPGVIEAAGDTVEVTSSAASVAVLDMLRLGFEHVLEGADHLLFLLTLLLPAPLVAVAGRWRHGGGLRSTIRTVVRVITSFTVGHSLTLVASALGWVSVPSRPVEVLIALSVAVSAVHAIRPLARHGEELIAAGFGLVHGLAFAGILADLGLSGGTSVLALLAFNVGIELAQLATAALVFPSLYVLSRTRLAGAVRVGGASIVLVLAASWALDRLGLVDDPFVGVTDAAVAHPWIVVGSFAALAAVAWTVGRPRQQLVGTEVLG